MIVVVEAAIEVETRRRRGSQANKIGEVDEMVVGEATGQINQILSAIITVVSMGAMQKSANQMLSATTALSMGTTQKSASKVQVKGRGKKIVKKDRLRMFIICLI
jgi:hypothetical protein